MIPRLPDRVRGVGTLCPCCKVPGTPESVGFGLIRTFRWTCGVCGARGDATRSRTPSRIMWHGLDMARVPVVPMVHIPYVRVRDLDREISVSKGRSIMAIRNAEKRGTVEAWTRALELVMVAEGLLRKKLSVALDK
jgi:hypothetical protein